MKGIFALLVIGCMLFGIWFFMLKKPSQKSVVTTIGIIQTASHPALDSAREGFVSVLQQNIGSQITFITKNAQGSLINAQLIAQSFHNNVDVTGILAIGTLAAQSMAQIEKEKPIFIAAVTDPVRAGLMHEKTNVCGLTDKIDAQVIVDLVQKIVPQAHKVAILFNVGEINSVVTSDSLEQELIKKNLVPIRVGFTSEAEIPAAAAKACTEADVLVTPPDNTVAMTISLIARIAQEYKKPLIVSDSLLVDHGALAGRGIDYNDSGRHAALLALEVLIKNKKPYEIPLKHAQMSVITVNQKTAHIIDIKLPQFSEPVNVVT